MAACGVAGDVELRRVAAVAHDVSVNPSDRSTGLADNIRNRHLWTQVVFDENNRCSALYERRREVTVIVFAAGAPIAAMYIDEHRTSRPVRRIDVQNLTRRTPVGYIEPRLQSRAGLSARLGASLGQLRILRHRFPGSILELELILLVRFICQIAHCFTPCPNPSGYRSGLSTIRGSVLCLT